MNDIHKLRITIRRLCEKLGKQKVRMFKGHGSTQPYYEKSSKQSLGDPGKYEAKIEDKDRPSKVKKDVTVSRIFIDEKDEDIGNEV